MHPMVSIPYAALARRPRLNVSSSVKEPYGQTHSMSAEAFQTGRGMKLSAAEAVVSCSGVQVAPSSAEVYRNISNTEPSTTGTYTTSGSSYFTAANDWYMLPARNPP